MGGREPGTAGKAPRADRRRDAAPRGLWLLALALAALVLLAATAWYAFSAASALYNSNRILPGVYVWGMDLSGATTEEAARLLATEWGRRMIVLDAGDARWSLPLDRLGLTLDAEATAQAARAEWRHSDDPDQIRQTLRQLIASQVVRNAPVRELVRRLDPGLAAPTRAEVLPRWSFRPDVAVQTLRTLAVQMEVPPQDASIRVVDGRVEALPPVTGQALDIGAALAAVEAVAERVALAPAPTVRTSSEREPSATLRLPIVPLEPTIADVSATAAAAAQLLAEPVTVRLWDPVTDEYFTRTVPPAELSRWLAFHIAPGSPSEITWSVSEEAVVETLRALEEELGGGRYLDRTSAVPALMEAFQSSRRTVRQRLHHFDRTHTVKAGETLSSIGEDYGMPYPWILKANPGLGDTLRIGQQITIPSQDNLLPLPPVEGKRIKVSLSGQKMQATEGGALKWEWPVSTGIKSSPTNPGVYQIQTHEEMAYAAQWDLYMPYFMGIYRPVPGQDFMNGFHGFPSRDRRQLLWTKNLGRPVTYGCILLSTENAKTLYEWAEAGVVVEIVK